MASSREILKLATDYRLERDVTINSSRIINMYAVPAEATTQGVALYPASGFQNPVTIGSGDIRQMLVFKDIMYVVSGDALYSVDTALVVTFIGNLNTLTGYVGMTANQNQVILVDGVDAYIWDTITSTFSTVVFGFTIAPVDVTMLDNYFVIPDGNTINFYVSALNNGTSWNVLNFALFQSQPDQLVATHNLKRRLYLFGNYSTEVWYDAGASDFPFRRDNNSLFEHGCASRDTIQEGFEVMFYLAQNQNGAAGVMMVQGTSAPQKVSSPEIDLYLQNVASLVDSEAILYKENGFTFYQLSFTTDNQTFVYIMETNKWHELATANEKRHPASAHAFFQNTHYIGMFDENKIYKLSYLFLTYRDDLIRCQIINPPLFDGQHRRIRIDRFELEVVTGMPAGTLPNQEIYQQLNALITQNKAPEAILFVSRDGGRTFGNGIRQSIGKLGDYTVQVLWRKLGCHLARRTVLKIEFPYFVPFIVLGGYVIFEVLPS